ncbi:hypothetical protein CapIbe_018046 [Capra ibex]
MALCQVKFTAHACPVAPQHPRQLIQCQSDAQRGLGFRFLHGSHLRTCVHIYNLPFPRTPRLSGEQSGPLTSCHRKVSGRSRESVPWDQTQISCLPAALVVAAVPVVLGAMGFTGAGIAASSIAAKMMSAAAVASGGGVAAGSLVATLQSVDRWAAGLSTSSNILLGSAGSAIGAWLWGS